MLDQTQVNLGKLLFGSIMSLGIIILLVNLVHYFAGLSALGVALIVLACSIAIERSICAHDKALREAFELGRDHERLRLTKVR